MKKFLLSMALTMSAGAVMAATVELDVNNATDFQGTYNEEKPAEGSSYGEAANYKPLQSLKIGDYTFTFTSTNTNAGSQPAYYYSMSTSKNQTQTIRVYGQTTMTVTAPADAAMGQIKLNGSNGKDDLTVTATPGAATYSSQVVTWANSEAVNSVSLTFSGSFRIKTIEISSEGGTVVTPPAPTTGAGFDLDFTQGMGGFTFEQGTIPEGLTYVWSQGNKYGLVASGYKDAPHATDAWAISPVVDLTDVEEPTFFFSQATNQFKLNGQNIAIEEALKMISVNIREEGGEWTALAVPTPPTSLSWTFVESGNIDLSAYIGKKVQIGFHYTSTDEIAGTWEIKTARLGVKGGGGDNPNPNPNPGNDYPLVVNDAYDIIAGEFIDEVPAEGDKYATAAHYQPLEECKIGDYTFTFTSTSENDNQQPALYLPMSTSTTGNKNFRVYVGSTMEITAPEGAQMTAIAVDGSNADSGVTCTADFGTATFDGNKLNWEYAEGTNTVKWTFNKKYRMYGFNIKCLGGSGVETVEEVVAIYVDCNNIVAPAGAQVYSINGVRVNGENLAAGLYIVRVNDKAVKVLVK